MKIESPIEKLCNAVLQVEKIAAKNHTLQIINCIYLEARKNTLTLRSTNLDVGIEISLPVKVSSEGVVVIPSNILGVFLSQMKGDTSVTLEIVENTLHVSSAKNATRIKTLPADEFPTLPVVSDEKTFTIAPLDFIRGLKAVSYAAAVSSIKAELASVYVYNDDEGNLVFVATDSFRLAEKRVAVKDIHEFGSLLIPHKNVGEIIRVLESAHGEVIVRIEKNQISFEFGHVYLTSRVIDGVFPDYKQIIPKESLTEVVMLKQDFAHSLKIAHIFSNKLNQVRVVVQPHAKVFEIQTKNSDIGENTNSIDAMFKGEDVEMNFNHKYIVDCLQSIDVDSVSLSFNGAARPLVIRGISDTSFLYLVMPMNR